MKNQIFKSLLVNIIINFIATSLLAENISPVINNSEAKVIEKIDNLDKQFKLLEFAKKHIEKIIASGVTLVGLSGLVIYFKIQDNKNKEKIKELENNAKPLSDQINQLNNKISTTQQSLDKKDAQDKENLTRLKIIQKNLSECKECAKAIKNQSEVDISEFFDEFNKTKETINQRINEYSDQSEKKLATISQENNALGQNLHKLEIQKINLEDQLISKQLVETKLEDTNKENRKLEDQLDKEKQKQQTRYQKLQTISENLLKAKTENKTLRIDAEKSANEFKAQIKEIGVKLNSLISQKALSEKERLQSILQEKDRCEKNLNKKIENLESNMGELSSQNNSLASTKIETETKLENISKEKEFLEEQLHKEKQTQQAKNQKLQSISDNLSRIRRDKVTLKNDALTFKDSLKAEFKEIGIQLNMLLSKDKEIVDKKTQSLIFAKQKLEEEIQVLKDKLSNANFQNQIYLDQYKEKCKQRYMENFRVTDASADEKERMLKGRLISSKDQASIALINAEVEALEEAKILIKKPSSNNLSPNAYKSGSKPTTPVSSRPTTPEQKTTILHTALRTPNIKPSPSKANSSSQNTSKTKETKK